jgi:hypothetical protein
MAVRRPIVITVLALLLLAGDVVWVGMLAWQLFAYGLPELPMFLVVVSGAGLVGWFLFALGAGLWELSIDAWWAVVAFLSLAALMFAMATIVAGPREDSVELGLFWTSLPTLCLIYMFRVRRFFNGPLSMNALAIERH